MNTDYRSSFWKSGIFYNNTPVFLWAIFDLSEQIIPARYIAHSFHSFANHCCKKIFIRKTHVLSSFLITVRKQLNNAAMQSSFAIYLLLMYLPSPPQCICRQVDSWIGQKKLYVYHYSDVGLEL